METLGGRRSRSIHFAPLVLITALSACGSGNEITELDTEEATSQYVLNVYSSTVPVEAILNEAATASGSFRGVETLWRPGIGHMELGPEQTGGEAIASFWMDIVPQSCINFETGEILDGCLPTFFFYQIGRPAGNIGDQDAYSYSQDGSGLIGSTTHHGVDSRGVAFIKGSVIVPFTINEPAIGELPAGVERDILVEALFEAVDR